MVDAQPLWSYMTTDLRTNTIVARELPLTDVSFSQDLNGKGNFTGTIPWGHPALTARLSDDGMRRVVWPMLGTVPVGAFVLASSPATEWTDPGIPLQCDHLATLADGWVLDKDVTWTNVDRSEIIRDLFRYGVGLQMQSSTVKIRSTYFDLAGIPAMWAQDAKLSGQLLTISFKGSDRKTIQACVDEVLKTDNPPEYRWLYGLDSSGLPFMKIDTGIPLVGNPQDVASRIVFEYPPARSGGAVTSAKYGFDSRQLVTRAHVIGQEREGSRPVGDWLSDWYLQGYPMREKVWSEQETDQTKLQLMAQGRIAPSTESWALTLNGSKEPLFGTYGLGDFVRFRTQRNGVRLADRDLRITGWTVAPDPSGRGEKVTPVTQTWG